VRYVARTAIFCGDSNNIGTLISAADMRLVRLIKTLNGWPVCAVKIVLACQFPSVQRKKAFFPFGDGRS